MGRFKEAEMLALEAKGIYETIAPPEDPSAVILLNNFGELYYKMAELQKAESFFIKARSYWEKQLGTTHPYYITNTNSLARVYWAKGEDVKADQYFTSALNGNFERVNSIFQFTNEQEQGAYLKNIIGSTDEYLSFYYKKGNLKNANQPLTMTLRNRNLILNSSQQVRSVIYNSADTALRAKFEDWQSVKQSLGRLLASADNKDGRVVALQVKADLLEKELSKRSKDFKQMQSALPEAGKIRSMLKADEAAIEFISFRYFRGSVQTDTILYAALVLTKDLAPQMIPLFEKQSMEALMEKKDINALYANSDAGLYQLVWQPMAKQLQGIRKVYYATSGLLHQVSFAAIPVSNTETLSDRLQLVRLNSTDAITAQSEKNIKPGNRLGLYGGVIYEEDASKSVVPVSTVTATRSAPTLSTEFTRGSSWNYLPGTRKEVAAITDIAVKEKYKVDLRQGIDATEESIKALHAKASPDVLHIATHGFFFPDPKLDTRSDFQKSFDKSGRAFKRSDDPLMRSGLLLAGSNAAWTGKPVAGTEDGILTSYEVSGLFLPNTKLVVLSACETALGDVQGSEGVYGLQRAFKMAGVQNLIMSLWKVPDNETAEFMQHFYKHYLGGRDIQYAFDGAMQTMKIKYRNEPVKWAAWIMIR